MEGNDVGLGFSRPYYFNETLLEVKQKFDINTR